MKKIIAFLYGIIPFKRALLSGVRIFWIPGEHTARHLHFKGIFNVPVDKTRSFKMKHYGTGFAMESDHFWRGASASEPYSVHAWITYVAKSDLILDIGANTGSYSLIAAAVNASAEIHAFEPVRRIAEKLEYNCALNRFKVHIHKEAVSSKTGTVYLTDQGRSNEYMSHVSSEYRGDAYEVPSTRIDALEQSLLKAKNILIKIDVEGHEAEVLSGMGKLLMQCRPVLLLEVLNETAAASLQPFFEGMHYVFFNIDERKGYRSIEQIEKSDGNNIFCCPAEKYVSLT